VKLLSKVIDYPFSKIRINFTQYTGFAKAKLRQSIVRRLRWGDSRYPPVLVNPSIDPGAIITQNQ